MTKLRVLRNRVPPFKTRESGSGRATRLVTRNTSICDDLDRLLWVIRAESPREPYLNNSN